MSNNTVSQTQKDTVHNNQTDPVHSYSIYLLFNGIYGGTPTNILLEGQNIKKYIFPHTLPPGKRNTSDGHLGQTPPDSGLNNPDISGRVACAKLGQKEADEAQNILFSCALVWDVDKSFSSVEQIVVHVLGHLEEAGLLSKGTMDFWKNNIGQNVDNMRDNLLREGRGVWIPEVEQETEPQVGPDVRYSDSIEAREKRLRNPGRLDMARFERDL